MSDKLYLVLDQTDEAVYYRVGAFTTIRAAYFLVLAQFDKNKTNLMYNHHYDCDEYEEINIYEVEEGLCFDGELGTLVAEFRRERYYDDEDDESYLKLVKCPTIEEVLAITEPTHARN